MGSLGIATWFDGDADVWVGYCAALDLYSQGNDREEAERAIEGAVRLWLKHAVPRRLERFCMKAHFLVRRG